MFQAALARGELYVDGGILRSVRQSLRRRLRTMSVIGEQRKPRSWHRRRDTTSQLPTCAHGCEAPQPNKPEQLDAAGGYCSAGRPAAEGSRPDTPQTSESDKRSHSVITNSGLQDMTGLRLRITHAFPRAAATERRLTWGSCTHLGQSHNQLQYGTTSGGPGDDKEHAEDAVWLG